MVTNLVMNLVTNLVIIKFGEELGDIFVTLFGDSANLVIILVTKFITEYGNEFINQFGD